MELKGKKVDGKEMSVSEISNHLNKYGTSSEISMNILGGHEKPVAQNVKVNKNIIEFDIENNIAVDFVGPYNLKDISGSLQKILMMDASDGAWEGSESNIFLIIKDKKEYATLQPKNVKISRL
jgi:hypothetical protein